MSDNALTRKVQVVALKKGESVPCDGRVYRDSNGQLWLGIKYTPSLEDRHKWILSLIEKSKKGLSK